MACFDPVMDQESACFAALEDASQWGYEMGDPAISYVEDGELPQRLLFEAVNATGAAIAVDSTEQSLVGILGLGIEVARSQTVRAYRPYFVYRRKIA